MLKKTALVLVGALVLLSASWFAWSKVYQGQQPLDQKEARIYLAKYMDRMHIEVNIDSLEDVYIDAGGNKLHLAVMPAADKAPTIVFIPGTMAYAYWYIEFYDAMKKRGYNVVGLDPRGHGQSSGARGDYTINELSDDALSAAAYARKRFGGPVFLVGSSQGGIAAFYAAARDSSLAGVVCDGFADLNGVDNLVLSSFKAPTWTLPLFQKFTELYSGFSIPTKVYLRLNQDLMKDGIDLETYYAQDPLWVDSITLRAFNSLAKTELAKPVEEITIPVMLLHADRDKIFPEDYVKGIYDRITSKKEYLFIENSEHIVTVNSVDRLVPGVDAWMKSVLATNKH